jgi:hypothetical protein
MQHFPPCIHSVRLRQSDPRAPHSIIATFPTFNPFLSEFEDPDRSSAPVFARLSSPIEKSSSYKVRTDEIRRSPEVVAKAMYSGIGPPKSELLLKANKFIDCAFILNPSTVHIPFPILRITTSAANEIFLRG